MRTFDTPPLCAPSASAGRLPHRSARGRSHGDVDSHAQGLRGLLTRALRVLALAAVGSLALPAFSQSVALQGVLGSKALLMVDGGPPRGVAPGETYQGVKVLSTLGDQAVVEIGGKRYTLRMGDAPASVGGGRAGRGGATKITLTVGSGGHFFSQGAINGRSVQFVVDTGATSVALSAMQAEQTGVDYKSGQPVQLSTANGVALGWRIKLASVRVGDVEVYDVDAVVSNQPMPYVLLGNSFLSRFQMRRDNDQMVLERRY